MQEKLIVKLIKANLLVALIESLMIKSVSIKNEAMKVQSIYRTDGEEVFNEPLVFVEFRRANPRPFELRFMRTRWRKRSIAALTWGTSTDSAMMPPRIMYLSCDCLLSSQYM